jgi:crossover junction endodeoxyribonuclease RuvC
MQTQVSSPLDTGPTKLSGKIIGVDPGATGAFAILDLDTRHLVIIDMPTTKVKRGTRNVNQVDAVRLAHLLGPHIRNAHAIVEKVHSMPGQGVASTFSFGRAAGIIEGVLAALDVPFSLVAPAVWTKKMRLFGGKDGSRARASELFPDQAHLFKRKKDDGRADAVLIACYGAEEVEFEPSIRLPEDGC